MKKTIKAPGTVGREDKQTRRVVVLREQALEEVTGGIDAPPPPPPLRTWGWDHGGF